MVATGLSRPGLPAARRPARPERPGRDHRSATRPARHRRDQRPLLAGRRILAAVYSGTVASIPDFAYAAPSTATINTNQNRNGSVTMTRHQEQPFSGLVTTSAFKDWGDPANPYGHDPRRRSRSARPRDAQRTVTWSTFQTNGAPQGVYTVWIQGHSSDPVLLDHYYPVGSRSAASTATSRRARAATVRSPRPAHRHRHGQRSARRTPTARSSAARSTSASRAAPTPMASCRRASAPSASARRASPSTRAPARRSRSRSTAGPSAPASTLLTLRVTGTNSAGQPVTRLVPITVTIATASTSNEYVDILGFTMFRITCRRSTGCSESSTATPSRACTPT